MFFPRRKVCRNWWRFPIFINFPGSQVPEKNGCFQSSQLKASVGWRAGCFPRLSHSCRGASVCTSFCSNSCVVETPTQIPPKGCKGKNLTYVKIFLYIYIYRLSSNTLLFSVVNICKYHILSIYWYIAVCVSL